MSDAPRRVTLGRISGVYGIKGWVKVYAFTRPLEGILKYPTWYLGPEAKPLQLVDGRAHAGGIVAQLAELDQAPLEDRDIAARWVGMDITVPREALPPTRNGEVYWVDLVGMTVVTPESVTLGQVTEVTSNGAQDVLVVAGVDTSGNAVERLIPFIRGPMIESVSLEERKIVAHWQQDW